MNRILALCYLSSAASCVALPLINPSFEAPTTPPDAYADVTPDDWFGIEPDDSFQISIRQGVRRSGVQSVAFNAGGTPPGASLSQAFSTTAGTGYELSFWTTANIPQRSSVRGEVWDGGELIGFVDSNLGGTSFNFTETRFRFVATSVVTTITIVDTSSETSLSDLFLDDVTVTELPLPVTLGYWRFEGGSVDGGANSIVDSSGNGHDGVPLGNLVYSADVAVDTIERTGQSNALSLDFDGTNSVVSIPHDAALDPTNSFTVEFWMRSSGTGGGQDLLVDRSHGFSDNTGWVFQSMPGTGIIFFGMGNGSGFPGVSSGADLFDDRWHHLAGTYDGTNAELFVDGVSQGTASIGTYQTNTRDVRMGNTWQQSRFFGGKLDEVRISEGVRLPGQLLYTPPKIEVGSAVRLTFDPGNEYLPEWDPRGTLIAFSTDRQPGDWRDIGSVEADGSNERLLATGIQSPFGLGVGPYCWIGNTGLLMVHDTVSTHEYLAFDVSMAPFNRTTSDGDDLAFTRKLFIGGSGGGGECRVSRDGSTALWRYSASGGGGQTTIRTAPYSALTGQSATDVGTVHITETPPGTAQIYYQGMAIAPDGSWFVIARPAGSGQDLWRYQTDQSTAPIELTSSGRTGDAWNRLPDISPDGNTIAFSYWSGASGDTNEIFLMDADGANPRNVTNTPLVSEANVTFSPDGKWIAYQRSEPAGSPGLMLGEVPNSNIFKLLLGPIDSDSDGLVDLLEAAFLLDPNTPDAGGAPSLVVVEDGGSSYVGLEYRREPGGSTSPDNVYTSDGYSYTIQTSTDGIGWSSAGMDIVYLAPTDNGDGSESVVVRLASDIPTDGARRFLRIEVSEN